MKVVFLFAAVFAAFAQPTSAKASAFYIETGAGISQMRSGSPFFGTGAPSVFDYGLDIETAFFFSFSGNSPLDFQLGLQGHLFNASTDTTNYALIAPYPMMRIQMSRIYLGLGATPFNFKRTAATAGFDSFQMVSGLSYAA